MTAAPQTLLKGGTLLTMVPEEGPMVADILFGPEGIVRIAQDIQPIENTNILNVSGAYVLPGFVQAHVHFCQTLFRGRAEQVPLLDWLEQRGVPAKVVLFVSARLIFSRLKFLVDLF